MSAAGPIAQGTGTGLNVLGAFNAGNSKAAADEYNAGVANQNAGIAEAQGAEQERRTRVMGSVVAGQQRAAYGASGVQSQEGSALDVLQNTAATAELDALTVKHNADVKAWGYRSQANVDLFAEKQARTGAWLGASSALIKGIQGGGGGGSSGSTGGDAPDTSGVETMEA